jgi:glycosyltransferase involved in cell wall biosynthesis
MSRERARPRLVCLTTAAACGGAETSLLTLVEALRAMRPEWHISVVAPGQGPLLDRCRSLGVGAIALPYPAALNRLGETGAIGPSSTTSKGRFIAQGMKTAVTLPQYVAVLRRTLKECRATVVHSNGVKAHISSALARPSGVRLVWHLHDYVQARPLTASLLRRLARRADAIVANSDSVLRDAEAAFGPSRRMRRIYNAVDGGRFKPEGPALDLARLAGMADDTGRIRIGLLATFARWKGHRTFIDAIARLEQRARVRAYVIGGPVYETCGSQCSLEELRSSVERAGLSGDVGFTGIVSDVPAALRGLDIVVHASTSPEPFGMAIAEGMSCARAVVAASSGGAAELIDDGITAMAHRAGDADDLARVLDRLIVDAPRRAMLGAAALEAARNRFAPPAMAAAFAEVYQG